MNHFIVHTLSMISVLNIYQLALVTPGGVNGTMLRPSITNFSFCVALAHLSVKSQHYHEGPPVYLHWASQVDYKCRIPMVVASAMSIGTQKFWVPKIFASRFGNRSVRLQIFGHLSVSLPATNFALSIDFWKKYTETVSNLSAHRYVLTC